MRKLLSLTFMFLAVSPVLANDNQAKIKAAVESRYQQWLTADNKKDAEAITDYYDDNAVLMPSREDPVLGKTAIGEWYKKLFADPHFVPFTLELQWNSFHVVGDIAIETGVFDGELTRNGKQIHFRGKNLILWKKQNHGAWRIFRYMYDEIRAGQ